MMSRPLCNPIIFNTLAVVISTALLDFSADEQAIIGAFLSTIGDMVSFNSAYLSYVQSSIEEPQEDHDDQYELLKKSIQKIQEELEKIKQ